MKRFLVLLVAAMFLFSFGCATKEYVKEQIDPLADRISKLEAKAGAGEMKSDQAAKDAAAAKSMAQEAMSTAKGCCDKSAADAERAEAAAKKAEAAAAEAKKAFELQQKK